MAFKAMFGAWISNYPKLDEIYQKEGQKWPNKQVQENSHEPFIIGIHDIANGHHPWAGCGCIGKVLSPYMSLADFA